jgi:hypothetical protein
MLSAWRLLVAASAFIGFGYAVADIVEPWRALSQQASLLTGAVYLALAVSGGRVERLATWLRGGMAVLLTLVCVTFLTLLGGVLDNTSSLFEHLITPVLVVADWVVVGRTRGVRWWYPLSWLVFPTAYLVYFVLADVQLYRGVLDPRAGDFTFTVAEFLVALLVAGYALYGIARVRDRQPVATREEAEWTSTS